MKFESISIKQAVTDIETGKYFYRQFKEILFGTMTEL